jgi:hypothetical protein
MVTEWDCVRFRTGTKTGTEPGPEPGSGYGAKFEDPDDCETVGSDLPLYISGPGRSRISTEGDDLAPNQIPPLVPQSLRPAAWESVKGGLLSALIIK